jgi:hypothetical protein
MSRERGWLLTCGLCGRDLVLTRSLTLESRAPAVPLEGMPTPRETPCEHCERTLTTGILDSDVDGVPVVAEAVCRLMGWCHCGRPEDVTRLVVAYLRMVERLLWAARSKPDYSAVGGEAAWWLLAYLCDGLAWTEHGGSVEGAWLTEDGRLAMQRMEAALATRSVTPGDPT